MKKSATRKSTARPARRAAKKSTARKAEPRLRNAAAAKATAPVLVEAEPSPYANPSFSRRTDTHSLLPTAVARMLEEESWWRVVRVSSPEPVAVKRGAKSSRSSRTLSTTGRSSSKH